MLSDFDEAIAEFEQVYLELDSSLCRVAGFSNRQRHKGANCAYDIISFAPILRETHLQAAEAIQNDLKDLLHQIAENLQQLTNTNLRGDSLQRDEPKRRLGVAYKAMFYFVRAYQDALCGVLLILLGQHAGKYTSMYRALEKENNPVRIAITEAIPTYRDWFYRWRTKRNIIKEGVNVGIAGPGSNVGIGFSRVDEKTGGLVVDCQDTVRLSDIVEALKMSTLLAKAAMAISRKEVG